MYFFNLATLWNGRVEGGEEGGERKMQERKQTAQFPPHCCHLDVYNLCEHFSSVCERQEKHTRELEKADDYEIWFLHISIPDWTQRFLP